MTADRGRLTIPDAITGLFAFAILGVLYPVFAEQFGLAAPDMGTGTEYVYLAVLPLLILITFTLWLRKAVSGG